MATPTDLNGYLRGEEDSLTRRIYDWWTKYDGDCAFNVLWTPVGASTPERLNKPEPITCKADVRGVENIVQIIQDLITDKAGLGTAPIGTLRIKGYTPGRAASPELDYSGTLRPPDQPFGDASLARVEGWNQELRRENAILRGENRQLVGIMGTAFASAAQAAATSATVRTASSASAELSGLGPMIALGVLVVAYPSIKEGLGLPQNAPLSQVLQQLKLQLQGATADIKEAREPASIVPESARTPKQITEQVPSDPLKDATGGLKAQDLLLRIANDPAFAADLKAGLASDVDQAEVVLTGFGIPAPMRAMIIAGMQQPS